MKGVQTIDTTAILDRDQLRNVTLDDEELMREILAALIDDTSQQIGLLKSAIAEEDPLKTMRLAHYSKGACANVGANRAAHVLKQIEQEAAEHLKHALTPEEKTKFRAELTAVWGKPYAKILEFATAHGVDLIVMGTHGRGALMHALMGSVAEQVVRHSVCPVLTIRTAPEVLPEQPVTPAQVAAAKA